MAPSVSASYLRSEKLLTLQREITLRYASRKPIAWSNRLPGIQTRLGSEKKCLALTFDACGYGKKSKGYDAELIAVLRREQVPATLFISGLWADAHPDLVRSLAADPLFEIENHGLRHLPCSVSGHSAYHISGTRDAADVVLEVEGNAEKLATLTGRTPRFYRAGTAMYDDVALDIVADLGYTVAGYSILGDAGATYSAAQVQRALLSAKPGDIVICHMNHPEGETCAGLKAAIPVLKAKGYTFVTLGENRPRTDLAARAGMDHHDHSGN
jgi:peptidoglycan/xylan/chitin deacetylase (PgdA/CDA1 family)